MENFIYRILKVIQNRFKLKAIMKNHILIGVVLIFCSSYSYGQTDSTFYNQAWNKVYRYELSYLPTSALKQTDSIYEYAKKTKNFPQVIKSIIYQMKFASILEEDHESMIVHRIEEEIAKSEGPMVNILESILGNIYWDYYKANRWRIYQRTKTANNENDKDFRFWDLETIFKEITIHYTNSLKNADDLQNIDISTISDLLISFGETSVFRPTVYDFLAHNALEFYKTTESRLTAYEKEFKVSDTRYFDSSKNYELPTLSDSAGLTLRALHLYEDLSAFHTRNKDTSAFVMLELERINFLTSYGSFENKSTLTISSLKNLIEEYKNHRSSTLIVFRLAELYYLEGQKYDPKNNKVPQFKKIEAIKLCESAIDRFPESIGATQCRNLIATIKLPSLSLTVEEFLPIQAHARILINYANLDQLDFEVYDTRKFDIDKFIELDGSEKLKFFERFTPEMSWKMPLKNLNDHQRHGIETVLPPLEQGEYLLVAKTQGEDEIFGYALTQVTNLAIVHQRMDLANRYQVLDRNSGQIIAGAQIRFRGDKRRQSSSILDKTMITDHMGMAFLKKSNVESYSLNVTVVTNNDTAHFDNHYLYKNYLNNKAKKEKSPIVAKPFVFTDRSIYRPGQTIFFKGILTQKQGDKTDIVPGEFVEVYFYDPNEDEIEMLRLKSNEFGSFSGEFSIPKSGLTGRYSISVEEDLEGDSDFYENVISDFEWNEKYVAVEEYKRPRFEVKFDSVITAYRLLDTVAVKGLATSFTGAPISNAKVNYKVTRTVRYPTWYYWDRNYVSRSSKAQEIVYGETLTEADGGFAIHFNAMPDEAVSKAESPIFNYLVKVDVTDVNGETRSAAYTIKLGYHTLDIKMDVPLKLDKSNSQNSLKIIAKNLNGQTVNVNGKISIFQKRQSHRILRKQPWRNPDILSLSEPEFIALFPHDVYDSDQEENTKGKQIFSTQFDTNTSETIDLPIASWATGEYIVELESYDKYDQLVTAKAKFKLIDKSDKNGVPNQIIFHYLDKPYYKVGEKLKLTFGSALKDVTVTLDIEKDQKIVSTKILRLSDRPTTITLPIDESDHKGFAIHYHLTKINDFIKGTQFVDVRKKSEALKIETTSFRDKLQSGTNETWSFKITSTKGKRREVEMLASMYDTSLDQFKSHDWKFNPNQTFSYYSSNPNEGYSSFGTNLFKIRKTKYVTTKLNQIQFDRFDWFGFSINNSIIDLRRYLERLRSLGFSEIGKLSSVSKANNSDLNNGYISGTITDEEGNPLIGTNIIVKGTTIGTIADENGNYLLKATRGHHLVFSFIGYQTLSVRVGSDNQIDVNLVADSQNLEEVVVIGYGSELKKQYSGASTSVFYDEEIENDEPFLNTLQGQASGVSIGNQNSIFDSIQIRGNNAIDGDQPPLIIVDGIVVTSGDISPNDIANMMVLKGEEAVAIYGSKATYGAVIISTKTAQDKMDKAMSDSRARKNFRETAFFLPHLKTNKKGEISFSFTTPESLTRWKLQLLAHNKSLKTGKQTLNTVTAKELMVIPNLPRFLRERDSISISTKVVNLTSREVTGILGLNLIDPFTNEAVNEKFGHYEKNKRFSIGANASISVSWSLSIPEFLSMVQYKIVASTDDFSDGEQNVLPILSSRTLVTETLPMHVKSGETKTFELEKLKNNTSNTLQHHKLVLEITSNPTWYALQALPYLMEYPYECAEQTFARFYANVIAKHIVTKHRKIKQVFQSWANAESNTNQLENNNDLTSIMIRETPWARDAMGEKEQKKQIAKLFDENHTTASIASLLYKLETLQLDNGGFTWFSGSGTANRFITQHILAGFAHLQRLNAIDNHYKVKAILKAGFKFLDNTIIQDYNALLKEFEGKTTNASFLNQRHINPQQIQYLYLRSFFPELETSAETLEAVKYYQSQSASYWTDFGLYAKAMIAIEKYRSGNEGVNLSRQILKSLKESSITDDERGMFWKQNSGSWQWHKAPIETQALVIEAFSEIEANDSTISILEKQKTIDNLKIWLLKNKQTNRWGSTKSTTEAIYALLLKGSDWLSVKEQVEVYVGGKEISTGLLNDAPEIGTGYYKTSWGKEEINGSLASVSMKKKEHGIAWGGLYWQYFQDLDKISSAATSLKLEKTLFKVFNSSSGEIVKEIKQDTKLEVGDKIRVRIKLSCDRPMEFLHLKDMRASGLEPINVLSNYKWQDGLGYYESTRDTCTNFFIEHISKGTYVFEYDLSVNNSGSFTNGITTIQSMYAPEYSSHSKGIRINIK